MPKRTLSPVLENGFRLVVVQRERFGPGEVVVLDGHLFEDCQFDGCTICYFGGPVGIRGQCTIDAPEWLLQGPGLHTAQMIANIGRLSPTLRKIVFP